MPTLEHLNRGDMPQGSLRNVVIVEPIVMPDLGLGMAWRSQPVIDVVLLTQLVEGVVARGLAVLLGEAVGEGLVVVGEQLGDDERGLLLEVLEEPQSRLLGLVLVPLHETQRLARSMATNR